MGNEAMPQRNDQEKAEGMFQDAMEGTGAFEAGVRSDRETSKRYPKVHPNDIKSAANGLPPTSKGKFPKGYRKSMKALHRNFDDNCNGKWAPGYKAGYEEFDYNPKSKKMEGYKVVLVAGNKVNEYHFFGKNIKRKPTPAEQEDIKKQEKAADKERQKKDAESIDEDAADLVAKKLQKKPAPESIKPGSSTTPQKMAAAAAKGLKSEGDYHIIDNRKNGMRVVGVYVGSGKKYYYGKRKG